MNKQTTALNALASVSAGGKPTSLASLVHTNPQLASDLAKLVTPITPRNYDNKGMSKITRPNTNDLKHISAKVAQSASDADAVMSLFSDVKIAAEILISSIRSPNDMYEGEVLFDLKDNLHCSPVAGKLLPLVRSYFKDVYPLSDKFEDILRSSLFGAGSYPILIIPENSLSDAIYGKSSISTEAITNVISSDGYVQSLGLLGKSDITEPTKQNQRNSLERLINPSMRRVNNSSRFLEVNSDAGHKISCEDIVILDNPLALQFPMMDRFAREQVSNQARSKLGKNSTKFSDRDLATMLYRNTSGREAEFVKLKTGNEITRYPVGRPLILCLPPESVIPVINRGRPEDPVGYIVILDGDGVPLSRMTEVSQFEALKASVKNSAATGSGDMSSFLLQRAASAFNVTGEETSLRQVNKIFGEILEADLSARLRNGAWGSEVAVSNSDRLSELMLYRVFKKQKTQILFVPEEMLTYFNYQVNENGTGRNLLQDSMVISSMRAQVLFARVMGAVKNSIGHTKVDVQIDPDEPDSQALFDMIKSQVISARQTATTPNSVNPTDVLNQIQAANIEFQVTGMKGMPETKVEFSETSTNYVRPDEELSKELADLMINHIGVPPEMVEDAKRPEFATVAIATNILFSKRVRHMQRRFDPQLTHIVINMLMCDSTFIIELKKLINANIELILNQEQIHEEIKELQDNKTGLVDLLCSEFVSGLKASLARPDLKSIENNLEALTKFEQMVEKALENVFSTDSLDASLVGEETFNKIDAVRKAAKAALMRRFMSENGMAPEVFEMISVDDTDVLAWDLRNEVTQHSDIIAKVMLGISKKSARTASAADLEQKKLNQPEGDGPEATDTATDTSSDPDDTSDEDGDGFEDLPTF